MYKKDFSGVLMSLVLVLVGSGLVIASTDTTGPVYGFTDELCIFNLEYFNSIEEMDEYSADDNGWEYNSYIKLSEPEECVRVIRVVETQPEEEEPPSEGGGSGGGGSGGGTHPGTSGLEPPDENSESEQDDYVDEILECWTNAMSLRKLSTSGKDQNVKNLSDGTFGTVDEYGDVWIDYSAIRDAAGSRINVNHLTIIVQMHEDVHASQDANKLRYLSKKPGLEISAYRTSYANYKKIQGAPPPHPNPSISAWDDFLGDSRAIRRQTWNTAVSRYDPLRKKILEGKTLTKREQSRYDKAEKTLSDYWAQFFNNELDIFNDAEYQKNKTTKLACD